MLGVREQLVFMWIVIIGMEVLALVPFIGGGPVKYHILDNPILIAVLILLPFIAIVVTIKLWRKKPEKEEKERQEAGEHHENKSNG